jgi:hypothetical protein
MLGQYIHLMHLYCVLLLKNVRKDRSQDEIRTRNPPNYCRDLYQLRYLTMFEGEKSSVLFHFFLTLVKFYSFLKGTTQYPLRSVVQ